LRLSAFPFALPGILRARLGIAVAIALALTLWLGSLPGALAQGFVPPAPGDAAWGAYRSGLGYPIGSDALAERAAAEGIDQRCLTTITVAWSAAPVIVAKVAAGLMEALIENVPLERAQAEMYAQSPYFSSEIDCTPSSGLLGAYDTTYGRLDFRGGGGRATYEGDEARILYQLDGRTMTGTWVEPAAAVRCESSVDGSDNWGRIVIAFEADFGAFTGEWSYCDRELSGSWTGVRVD